MPGDSPRVLISGASARPRTGLLAHRFGFLPTVVEIDRGASFRQRRPCRRPFRSGRADNRMDGRVGTGTRCGYSYGDHSFVRAGHRPIDVPAETGVGRGICSPRRDHAWRAGQDHLRGGPRTSSSTSSGTRSVARRDRARSQCRVPARRAADI